MTIIRWAFYAGTNNIDDRGIRAARVTAFTPALFACIPFINSFHICRRNTTPYSAPAAAFFILGRGHWHDLRNYYIIAFRAYESADFMPSQYRSLFASYFLVVDARCINRRNSYHSPFSWYWFAINIFHSHTAIWALFYFHYGIYYFFFRNSKF